MKSTTPREPRKVTIIPATPKRAEPGKPANQKLRVAAYCRVSTEEEEQQGSFETQKLYYTEKINSTSEWELAGIYADDGISGIHTKKRDGFNQMIQDCKKKKIDLILTKSISRFARNTLDSIQYVRMLKAIGIAVIFEKENINTSTMNSEMILTVLSAFAQAESESISQNVARGKRMGFRQGKFPFPYGQILGYRKGLDGKPEVIPEEAEVIRMIFNSYLQGASLLTIKKKLEAGGVLTARGNKKWSSESVQRILQNEKYCGDVLLQKTYKPSLFSDHAIANNGDLPKYYIAGCLPQILEPDIFDRAQEELARRVSKRPASEKAKTPFGRYSGKYALSTLVVCGKCGALYRRITWHRRGKVKVVWRCGSHQDKAASCPDSPTIEETALQSAVMEAISQQYIHKNETMEVTMQSIRSVLTPETADSEYAIRAKITELQKERKALIAKALAENDDGKYDFQFARIKRELEQLQAQLEGVQAMQKTQAVDEARTAEIASLLEKFKEKGLTFDDLLVRKVVETVQVESAGKLEVTFKDGNRKVVALPERG